MARRRFSSAITRELVQMAEAAGLLAERRRNSHWRITTPDGACVAVVPSTPSCSRSGLNTRADIRRAIRTLGATA